MSNKETGGPAFPEMEKVWNESEDSYHEQYNKGMTLRDYFASKSPFGINQALDVIVGGRGKRSPDDIATIQEIADAMASINYLYADAMIKERKK